MNLTDAHQIKTVEELEARYRKPGDHVKKATLDFLHDFHIEYLKLARIVCIGSGADEGYDVSPRGGEQGFVRILDRRTLAIPDFPGNNKLETLHNLVRDERVALLFLFPGLDIFLRISGSARVTQDPALLQQLTCEGKLPITAIVVAIAAVYFHCGRAINRSHMWDAATHVSRESLPSPGAMMKVLAQIGETSTQELDEMYKKGMVEDLY